MTSEEERHNLLRAARAALEAHLIGVPGGVPALEGAAPRRAGAFVTLEVDGVLRGCIGQVAATEPLGRVVARCAVSAATSDPRFPAVTADELTRLSIEISILGPLEPIGRPEEIEIGRHGIVLEKDWRKGLLLPQVAVEWDWSPAEFLEQVCRKAGLPGDAWRSGASIWRFEAEVFGEGH